MHLFRAATAAALVVLVGCANRKGIQIAAPSSVSPITQWKSALDAAIGGTTGIDYTKKETRDFAIGYTTALIMGQYGHFRMSLMSGRAISSIGFDVIDLGTTAAVPIVNGARGKTILGSLATGFKGTQLSIDRNLFNQQTTAAILTAMDGCVIRQRRVLDTKRVLPPSDYSIYDAYSDLVTLYGCTTLAGAMEELVETQAAATQHAKNTLLTITEQERDSFVAAQKAYFDSSEGDKTLARKFLTEMGVTDLPANAAKQDFIDAYRKLAFPALTDADAKAKFLTAAAKVGLIKQP